MASWSWSLLGFLVAVGAVLWAVTEWTVKPVFRDWRASPRSRLIVVLAPYVLGTALLSVPGMFSLLVEVFGHEFRRPPEGLAAASYGVLTGFVATALHATGLGPLLRDRVVGWAMGKLRGKRGPPR